MDKQWDNYFALTEDAAAVTKEVWITTPGGERPLPLGFAACRAGGDVAEAVALQKALILWCAEGLHPKLAPFLRGKAQSEIPNFKGSYLGRFLLVSADFWTSDHLSERFRSVDAFPRTGARGTLTLKRR